MDAFFASIEERDSPQFLGLPIAVGSDPKNGKGRGVVSTANYKAREYGIKSAVPISKAWFLSEKAKSEGKPPVVFLPPDFSKYEKSSANILKIIKSFSQIVEQGSIDEFYFDLSPAKNYKSAEALAKKIKKEIKEKERVTCSIGIGPNKLISKIAAGIKKPDGLFVVSELGDGVSKFLEPLSIRELPGIGPKTEQILNNLNIYKVKDLKTFSQTDLQNLLGKWGIALYQKARGIDESELEEYREAKSIGEQETFETDSINPEFIISRLENMCLTVFSRFRNSGFKTFKTVAIVVRFSDFKTQTSAKTLKEQTNNYSKLKLESLKLLLPYLDSRKNPKNKAIRLIGVRIERLSS